MTSSKGWEAIEKYDNDQFLEAVDVMPENDLFDHTTGKNCHCEPEVDYEANIPIVIHNAFDLRDVIEEANEILNHGNQN